MSDANSSLSSEEHFDLVVIGAGQGGGPLAGAFARAGRRVALVERVHVGGMCINEGCSPTKTVIASARVAHLARRAASYGVHVTDDGGGTRGAAAEVVVDLGRVHERKQQTVDSFRSGSERSLAAAGVELVRGQARFVGPRTVIVTSARIDRAGENGARILSANLVVVNTGLRAAVPPLPGIDGVPYLTSTSILELTERPDHLIVLGGGYVGLEFAQAHRRFGSRVTVVQRDAQLLPHEDGDVAEAVATIMRLETSSSGVYAIGDVKGGPAFTHISYDDFRVLRTNLIEGGSTTITGRLVPYTVFIDPQLGAVGMTEREARAAGKSVRVATLPMSSVARALEVDETRGFMKAVVDADTNQILGATVLGLEGGEIATLFQVAMMGKLPTLPCATPCSRIPRSRKRSTTCSPPWTGRGDEAAPVTSSAPRGLRRRAHA